MILHIPHASRVIPENVRAAFLITDPDIESQLLKIIDHYTDDLFEIDGSDFEKVIFPVSRLVVDPERFLNDADEPMAAKGMGVVYEKTTDLKPLRERPNETERMELIERFYHPHHKRLTELVVAPSCQ